MHDMLSQLHIALRASKAVLIFLCHDALWESQNHVSQVHVSTGLGIAHQLHRGSSKEGVMLSASKHGKHQFVRIR